MTAVKADEQRWISLTDACVQKKISSFAGRDLILRGTWKGRKVGSRWFVHVDSIDRKEETPR